MQHEELLDVCKDNVYSANTEKEITVPITKAKPWKS